jgi:hypothetical protein
MLRNSNLFAQKSTKTLATVAYLGAQNNRKYSNHNIDP